MKTHWFTVQTTPTQLARTDFPVKTWYWVNLREYRRSRNKRTGLEFNKFIGFIHISDDLFSSRIEALRFGREEVRKRMVRP